MAGYLFAHQGATYDPHGRTPTPVTLADHANRCTEAAELASYQTHPDRVFAYVRRVRPEPSGYFVKTRGTAIAWAGSREHAEAEIARLQHDGDTRPLFVVAQVPDLEWSIGTWLGTPIATHVTVNPHRTPGFNGSYRHHVRCKIAGAWYSGWYYASSGDYCRLRKCQVQS